jgi:hypothetical protein
MVNLEYGPEGLGLALPLVGISLRLSHLRLQFLQHTGFTQCCGSGSGAFLPLDPGWGKTGSGMNIPDPLPDSLETVLWLKYLNSLTRIRYPESF